MATIKLVGWAKEPIEIESLEVNVSIGYVWLCMIDKDGHKYETGLLKEDSDFSTVQIKGPFE